MKPYANASREQIISWAQSYERRALAAEKSVHELQSRCTALRRVLRDIDEFWSSAATSGRTGLACTLSPHALISECDKPIAAVVAEALRGGEKQCDF